MGTIERKISSYPDGVFLIEDRITPIRDSVCEIPFRFGPSFRVASEGEGRWRADGGTIRLTGACQAQVPIAIRVETSTYWPRFYTELPVPLMIVQFQASSPVTVRTVLGPTDQSERVAELARV